jgi:hypothetical protein
MKTPRQFAAFVYLFCVFSLFQGLMWHWRPEPGWHPSWWQLHTLAWFGFFIIMPLTVMPVVFLQSFDISNDAVLWAAFVFGILFEFALVYLLAYGFAKLLSRILHGFRNHTKVV